MEKEPEIKSLVGFLKKYGLVADISEDLRGRFISKSVFVNKDRMVVDPKIKKELEGNLVGSVFYNMNMMLETKGPLQVCASEIFKLSEILSEEQYQDLNLIFTADREADSVFDCRDAQIRGFDIGGGEYIMRSTSQVDFSNSDMRDSKFIGSVENCVFEHCGLSNVVFRDNVNHCDFSSANLSNTAFCGYVSECDFDNAYAETSVIFFKPVDDSMLSTFNFRYITLYGSTRVSKIEIRNVKVKNWKFRGDIEDSCIYNSDFQNATLNNGCVFSGMVLDTVRFLNCEMESFEIFDSTIKNSQITARNEGFRSVRLENCKLESVRFIADSCNLENLHFYTCSFKNVEIKTYHSGEILGLLIENVSFTNNEPLNLIPPYSRISSSEFRFTDFNSTKFDALRFNNVVFRGCDLSKSSFVRSSFENSKFEDCELTGALFTNVDDELFDEKGLEQVVILREERMRLFRKNLDNLELDFPFLIRGQRLDSELRFIDAEVDSCSFQHSMIKRICFEKSSFINNSFADASFDRVLFKRSELVNCDFSRVRYEAVLVYGASSSFFIEESRVLDCNFRGAVIEAQMYKATIENCDLSDAVFYISRNKNNGRGILFKNCKLENTVFIDSYMFSKYDTISSMVLGDMSGAIVITNEVEITDKDLSSIPILTGSFVDIGLNNVSFRSNLLKDFELISGSFWRVNCETVAFEVAKFKQVMITECMFNNCTFENCTFTDCEFEDCDFSTSMFKGCVFEKCRDAGGNKGLPLF